MSLRDDVVRAMADFFEIVEVADGVLVTMPCIYPSNGLVNVRVTGGPSNYMVSDDGGAMREIDAAGVETEKDPVKALRTILGGQDLEFEQGVIHAPIVEQDKLAATIAIIANASKDSADWFYDNARIRRRRKFKEMVKALLARTFEPERVESPQLQGASSKLHNFDMVIGLDRGRLLAVDAVVHEGNSINSAVVAHMDVKQRQDPRIIQRIVYDDQDETWATADLNLMALGATLLPYSRSSEAFQRFTRMAEQ